MNHSFNVEQAKKYGILEAVLISNFEFWIAKNKANETHFYDGKYWVYNSTRALAELFPYANEQQIKRALAHLREENVLITGNYNKSNYDKTLWYTFSNDYQSMVQKETIDSSNLTNRLVENDQPIPNINTITNIYPPISPQGESLGKQKSFSKLELVLKEYECSEELKNTILDFIEMRKTIKKPMSSRALELMLKKLNTLASQEKEKIEILEQSIMNSWQGIFPLREDRTKTSVQSKDEREIAALYERLGI